MYFDIQLAIIKKIHIFKHIRTFSSLTELAASHIILVQLNIWNGA